MGTFSVEIGIAALERRQYRTVEAMVDTGATYVSLPASLLRQLGVEPHERRSFVLADGSHIDQDVGFVWLRLDGREAPTVVVFGAEGASPLLGAVALETFGLAVDPVGRRLMPVPGYLLALTFGSGRRSDPKVKERIGVPPIAKPGTKKKDEIPLLCGHGCGGLLAVLHLPTRPSWPHGTLELAAANDRVFIETEEGLFELSGRKTDVYGRGRPRLPRKGTLLQQADAIRKDPARYLKGGPKGPPFKPPPPRPDYPRPCTTPGFVPSPEEAPYYRLGPDGRPFIYRVVCPRCSERTAITVECLVAVLKRYRGAAAFDTTLPPMGAPVGVKALNRYA